MECLLRHAYLAAADLGGAVPVSWWLQGAGATALLVALYYFLLLPMDWTRVSGVESWHVQRPSPCMH